MISEELAEARNDMFASEKLAAAQIAYAQANVSALLVSKREYQERISAVEASSTTLRANVSDLEMANTMMKRELVGVMAERENLAVRLVDAEAQIDRALELKRQELLSRTVGASDVAPFSSLIASERRLPSSSAKTCISRTGKLLAR